MAKADGRVTRDEVEAFKDAFKVSPGEMKEAARAFNLAKYVCTTDRLYCLREIADAQAQTDLLRLSWWVRRACETGAVDVRYPIRG
jgi:hypothetical protein